MTGILCPECGYDMSSVYTTRRLKGIVRRYRICLSCGHHYITEETSAPRDDPTPASASTTEDHQ